MKNSRFVSLFDDPFFSTLHCLRYDSAVAQGIRPHVDEGAFSVNCWLTPDAARRSHRGEEGVDDKANDGGLRLFRGPGVEGAALEAALREAVSGAQGGSGGSGASGASGESGESGDVRRRVNQDFRSLRAVVAAAAARNESYAVDVGYKQNRCVAFESGLLHETSPALHFRPGYRRRRINLTFMFGSSAS